MSGFPSCGVRPKLLFTGAGGAGTIEVLQALRAKNRYVLVGCDATRASVGFTLVDTAYVIPFGASPEFEPAFRKILERERPDFVIPLVDEEIPIVHRLAAREFPEVRVIAPEIHFCEDTLDKWRMFERLRDLALPVAATWLASDAAAATYPAIVKPRSGRGSRGLAFLDGPADLAKYLAAASQPADRFIVQERLIGREFTTSVVVTLDDRCLAVVPKEAASKKGITQIGITRAVPAIEELGRNIQEKMRAGGPFNVQLMLCEDGVPRVFEINPRYSTTVALTLAAGIDEVDAVIRCALGEELEPLEFEPDLMMLRYSAQVFVKESKWHPIDTTRGELG
jgi:carbamoyl-phosphate synthase large subunit